MRTYLLLLLTLVITNVPAQTTDVSTLQQQLEQLRQTVMQQEMKLSQQQREMQNLRGENDIFKHQLEQLKRQQQDIYLDLDQRLRNNQQSDSGTNDQQPTAPTLITVPTELVQIEMPKTETSVAETVVEKTPTIPEPKSVDLENIVGQTEIDIPKDNEQAAYQAIFSLLQDAEYQQAAAGFHQMLQLYPQGQYADNAQYWLGESLYALQKFNAALIAFNQLIEKYPNSSKKSHAQLKIGYIYYEQKDYSTARLFLDKVKQEHAGTSVARLAEERLRQLRLEGN